MVREHINEFKTFLLVALHGLVPIGLIFKQGDDGTMLVFVFMVVSMMFAAGVKPVYFLGGATLVGAVIPFLWDRLIADKLDRFLCLIYVDDYIMETGWQQYLGLRALGSGQLWGRGFMEGGGTGPVRPEQRLHLHRGRRGIRLHRRHGRPRPHCPHRVGALALRHHRPGSPGDVHVHRPDVHDRVSVPD